MRILLISLSLLLLAACGGKDENSQAKPYGSQSNTEVSAVAAHDDIYADVTLANATVNSLAAGINYDQLAQPLPTKAPGKVEVLEVFWYGCPHCNRFQPYLHDWLQRMDSDVVYFERIPAPLNGTWEIHARNYYTAEALNVIEQSHYALFEAIHSERQPLFSKARLADFYSNYGIEESQYEQVFDSFGVSTKINAAKNTMAKWQVSGVPMLLINGKYKVNGQLAGSEANMIRVMELLIEREQLLLPSN